MLEFIEMVAALLELLIRWRALVLSFVLLVVIFFVFVR